MYSHILVPIAFEHDDDGAAAIAIARALSEKGARITLLHVMDEVPAYALSYMPQGYRNDLRIAVLDSLQTKAAELPDGHAVVTEGHAANTIMEWADEHGVDCIVIASHRPGLSDYFLGSTAARVVRHAQCAVHVLR